MEIEKALAQAIMRLMEERARENGDYRTDGAYFELQSLVDEDTAKAIYKCASPLMYEAYECYQRYKE